MEQELRDILRRNRVRLVQSLQVKELWDLLVERGVFSNDMIEEIQREGTRRDQARKLLVELETRGSQAFPLFLLCLKETAQHDLADFLQSDSGTRVLQPIPTTPSPVLKPLPKAEAAEYPAREIRSRKGTLDKDKDYPMSSDPIGSCLIINNMNFHECTGLSTRTGSDIDRDKLANRMRSFHFEVTVKDNLTGQAMHDHLQALADQDHSLQDCCLVVILSHGCETRHIQFPGGVYGTDGIRIPVERIVSYFNGSKCPSLRGKPKIFIIQACGGDQKDKGCEVTSDTPPLSPTSTSLQSDATPVFSGEGDRDEVDAVSNIPTPSDILVSYSTFPGYVSWRDKHTGSWYVEVLDSVLAEHAAADDLQSLLVMVADGVSSKGTYKQIPGYFNFLRKRFYFKTD
uniref:Casp9-A protein n=1 Tax=Xenopus laevis TaxID=8355 RepID=B7ZRI4_XENLA|nr:Casp9-A protein [Xenopus laevis]AAI70180.1 Casp9-A protein [Xenopus laevis]